MLNIQIEVYKDPRLEDGPWMTRCIGIIGCKTLDAETEQKAREEAIRLVRAELAFTIMEMGEE